MAVAAVRPQSTRKLVGGSAAYLVSHRRLLLRVTMTEVRARYAGSLLGFGWAFLAPFLILGIYSIVYLGIYHSRATNLDTPQYVVYIFTGLVPYLMTAEAMSLGVTSVVANKSVLNNTVFPIDLTPAKAVFGAQFTMAVGMVVTVIGAVATGEIHRTILLLPVVWALNLLWLLGVNWVISLLNVVFRDLQNLVTSFLMLMLIVSPFAFTPDQVPHNLKILLAANPFAYFVVAYQQVVVLGIVPSVWHSVVTVAIAVSTFALGSWFFAHAKRVIVDYV
jgi:lipopolysaccharide transport system permease protein